MAESEKTTIYDYGLASENKKKIESFLEKIYYIPFNKPKEWEKEIFDFFSKELIVPYVVATSIENFESDTFKMLQKDIVNQWGGIFSKRTVSWDSNDCYRNLIRIRESLKTGKKLKEFLRYFFINNVLIRRMLIKRTDEEDTNFQKYKSGLQSVDWEKIKEGGRKVYTRIFFLIPDLSIDYPLDEWSKKINQIWDRQLENLAKPRKEKKRDPIESRLRHEVFKRDDYKCVECGKDKSQTTLHIDHILPVSQGGKDEMDNLQTLCQACNLAKSNKNWNGGKNG